MLNSKIIDGKLVYEHSRSWDKEIIKRSKRKLFNKMFLKMTHFQIYIRLSWQMNQKARRALAHEFKAEASGSIIIGFCD